MKKYFIILNILCAGLNYFTPAILGFPFELRPGYTFTEFKNQMEKKGFESETNWLDSTKNKTLEKRTVPCWQETTNFPAFTKPLHLTEYSYSNICPEMGTVRPDLVSSFFLDKKLAALKILFNDSYSFEEILNIIMGKYGSYTRSDMASKLNISYFWENDKFRIELRQHSATLKNHIELSYEIMPLTKNDYNRNKKNDIDF